MSMRDSRSTGAAVTLVMLLLVYSFNFIDRQIIGILAPAIKADLLLSDAPVPLAKATALVG